MERELDYKWLASDGHVDVTATMRLLLNVKYEPGCFSVSDLIHAECVTVEVQARRDGIKTTADQLCDYFSKLFVDHYEDDVMHLADDVEDVACQQFGSELVSVR